MKKGQKKRKVKSPRKSGQRLPKAPGKRGKPSAKPFASLSVQNSLVDATLFADLHHKVQDFILNFLENFTSPESLNLKAPLPGPVSTTAVMATLVDAVRQALPQWNADPDNFSLGGPELWGATQGKALSYLVQYVFQKVKQSLQS